MMKRYTLSEIQSAPTLEVGHMEDLKFLFPGIAKVWVSRMTVEDGMEADNMVMVEYYNRATGRWYTIDTYPAI